MLRKGEEKLSAKVQEVCSLISEATNGASPGGFIWEELGWQ